ncbi:unnamed protein product, partial [Hapterophycus canaliculatus]
MFRNLWNITQQYAYSYPICIYKRFLTLIKRTNGQLNIQQKMNMTTIKLKRYILISLTKIYLDLIIDCKAGDRLYFIYRIIIIVLFIYTFINNNPSLLLELLDNLNYNYLNQLYDD